MSKYSQAAQMMHTLIQERNAARYNLNVAQKRIAELERQLEQRCTPYFQRVELKAKTEAWQMLRGVLRAALYAMQPDCSKCRNKKQSIGADAVFCDAGGWCRPEYGEVGDD